MSNQSFTVREYNPITGTMISDNMTSLQFRAGNSGHTQVKVIDIKFHNFSEISNVKLAIVSNAGLVVNSNPQDIDANNTSSTGRFGIETTSSFDPTKGNSLLQRHFRGVNTSLLSTDNSNAIIPMRSNFVTNFIYLDIETGVLERERANGGYKLFYDFVS